MTNAFVSVKVGVACMPEDTVRRVLQRLPSTTLPMRRLGVVLLSVLPVGFYAA